MPTLDRLRRALLPLLLAAPTTACASFASFQEAETVPRGESRTGIGATYTTYEVEVGDDTATVGVPAVDVWHRRGVTDRLEAHASVWIPLGASAGVKYQLAGDRDRRGVGISLGGDLGVLQISAEDAEGNESKATIVDVYVPVYLGYRFGAGFATYLSPKYILRIAKGDDGTATGHLAGGTAGVAIGAGATLHLEGTVMYDVGVDAPAIQGGVGIAW